MNLGSLQVGEAPQVVYPYAKNPRPQEIPFQSRSGLEMLMEENKKLRERVLALVKSEGRRTAVLHTQWGTKGG